MQDNDDYDVLTPQHGATYHDKMAVHQMSQVLAV